MKFNAEQEVERIVAFIRSYYEQYQLGGVVLGISGGKDSAVVAALFVKALGKEQVLGLTLPCHSKEEDRVYAKQLSDFYGFPLLNFDLTRLEDDFDQELKKLGTFSEEERKNSDINLKPRLRMATVYYFAALMSALKGVPYLVAGTSNRSECYVGYFTKGGDSVHDIAVLADFTVEEVLQIGEVLQVPKEILYKVPSDGLSNQTDEEKLGVTYQEIGAYLNDPNQVSEEARNKIELLHQQSRHKFILPTYKRG